MKTKKCRIKLNAILILIVIVLIFIMAYCIFDIFNNMKSTSPTIVEVLDKIDGYDYELNENDSTYFETLFGELKTVLESEEIEEKDYASLVAQLFVTDFYSLDYAINKNDVGGIQFVYTPYQSDFISKAKSSIYNYVENNIYNDREQELPVVTDVSVDSVESLEYSFDNDIVDSDAYIVNVSISYSKDLGYPIEAKLVLIHNEGKLEVAKMS